MDLNIILIILGALALMILVGHGIWSNRREKTQIFQNTHTFSRDIQAKQSPQQANTITQQVQSKTDQFEHNINVSPQAVQDVTQIKIIIPQDSTAEQTHYHNITTLGVHSQEALKVKLQDNGDNIAAKTEDIFEQTAYKKNNHLGAHTAARQQIHIQMSQSQVENITDSVPNQTQQQRTGNIILYVVAAEGAELQGSTLVPALENLGLIYSEQGIFHRYFDTVASPILYSVANVRKPGTFNLNDLEQFSTVGVVLFMQLSSNIRNDQLNFNTMVLDAEQLAKLIGGFVLDDQQEIFSEQSKVTYQQKIQG